MYLLDTNVLIQSSLDMYRFTTFPSFWKELELQIHQDNLKTIDRVIDEIMVYEDDISRWTLNQPDKFAIKSTEDQEIVNIFGDLVNLVNDNKFQVPFKANAIRTFLRKDVDLFCIATSSNKKCTLVTLETYDGKQRDKVKIPAICKEIGVRYISPFDMLEELNFKA